MKQWLSFFIGLDCLLTLNSYGQNTNNKTFAPQSSKPLVTEVTSWGQPKNGLAHRHIAMWQSHGRYYEGSLDRWEWQRARLMQTVEDLYTQSYVLPFLVPMLEDAGANVLLPRERDWNVNEYIVDNDGNPFHPGAKYMERSTSMQWETGTDEGFAYKHKVYRNGENPFKEGTYRMVSSIKRGMESEAIWYPSVAEDGEYAVYISYHTLPNSTKDATYTVYHQGGKSVFKVNQQMGGGTWIYLGKFCFSKNNTEKEYIVLSNKTSRAGEVVTADAVKIGGGMGNIGRPDISNYPRFTEGARYWMQWAGVPDSIYSPFNGRNDYKDDYSCRGRWVNWLAGGSQSCPLEQGINIPIDLSFAFHSDAGTTRNDSVIGTLGIYYSHSYNGLLGNGASRELCKDLTDKVQSSIINDIRTLYEPNWRSRGSINEAYSEATFPRVPAMLLELLSHQNFADMRYGLDPRFRFTVSRAIYKGMLRFISEQRKQRYVVTPLPVSHVAAQLLEGNQVRISWKPVNDPIEPTAVPNRYIIYMRLGDGAFDEGRVVKGTSFITSIPQDLVCSFKIVAMNNGGKSFPSEVVSVGKSSNSRARKALIINGFDRISAPADFVAPAPLDTLYAGFMDQIDHGVPYIQDISYTGSMKDYDRSHPWVDDDAGGYGDSYGNEETKVIAGNTFDYIAVHGKSILKAGLSFDSESAACATSARNGYAFVDLILGKQCQTKMGRGGVTPLMFKTFPKNLQQTLTGYACLGTSILVSGAFVGTDLWNNPLAPSIQEDTGFATKVLKYKWRNSRAAITGDVAIVRSPLSFSAQTMTYSHTLNDKQYIVESPDAIEPATEDAYTVMRYPENNLSAAVASQGSYNTFVMGVPFESITDEGKRNLLMGEIVRFFSKTTPTNEKK